MTVTDPRERYDDLLTTESREFLDPDEFADAAESEAVEASWVVLAFTFDGAGRLLLIRQPWADGWIAPGGARKPGETLEAAVVRELREETGVEVSPVEPRAVDEFTFENERTGETAGWNMVLFEATTDAPEVDRDPAVDDEEVTEIRWFEGLPDDLYNPELVEPAYERCVNGR